MLDINVILILWNRIWADKIGEEINFNFCFNENSMSLN